jgi:hypothetical protein
VIPTAGALDFDAHLQRAISALQDLNDTMVTDVAVLYSANDLPAPGGGGNRVHPMTFHNDLTAAGYNLYVSN